MGWKFWKQEPRVQDAPRVQDLAPAGSFVMPVGDVFSIHGRGTVATGQVASGRVQVGDQVVIMRAGQQVATSRVTGIEAFRKKLTMANAGDNVGLLLEGIDRSQLLSGDLISR